MKVTRSQINKIVKRIPIGYYFGKSVPVVLSENSQNSYFTLSQGSRIVISLSSLMETLSHVSGEFNEETCERVLRSLIYHELSHAMMTPELLFRVIRNNLDLTDFKVFDSNCTDEPYFVTDSQKVFEIVNIVEDQRIELLTKNIYKGIDYEELLNLVKPFDDNEDESVVLSRSDIELFFDFIRHGRIPSIFEEVSPGSDSKLSSLRLYLISERFTSVADYNTCLSYARQCVYLYCKFIHSLDKSRKFLQENNPNEENNPNKENSSNEESTDSRKSEDSGLGTDDLAESVDSTSSPLQSRESQNEKVSSSTRLVRYYEDLKSETSLDEHLRSHAQEFPRLSDILRERQIKDTENYRHVNFSEVVNPSLSESDRLLENRLKEVLLVSSKSMTRQSSASNSYSGVFDPRQVVREDYKYFLHTNNSGSSKLNNKVRLNLFVDRSGSFRQSEVKVNILLRVLHRLMSQDSRFSFTMTTIGIGCTEEDIDRFQVFNAYDGTYLSPDIVEIFKRQQDPRSINLNLVLIDGYAWNHLPEGIMRGSLKYKEVIKESSSAFNSRNTVIITDLSNSEAFRTYAPLARLRVCHNYADVLLNEVVTTLKKVMPLLSS